MCHNDTPSDRRYISSSRKIYSFDRYVGLKATKRDSGSGWTSEGLGDFGRGHNGKKSRSPPYNGGTGPARADVNPTRNSGKFLRLNELVIEREHDTGGLCVLSEIQDELDSFSNRGKGPSGSPHKEREPGITPGKRGGIPGYPNNGDLGAKEEHNDTIGEVNDNVGLEGIHLYPDIQLSLRKLLDGRRLMKAQIVMMRTLTSNKLKPCPYVVISATGTGKTLAYLACVLNAVAHCMRCPLPTTAHDSAIGAIPQDPAAQYSPYMQESVSFGCRFRH